MGGNERPKRPEDACRCAARMPPGHPPVRFGRVGVLLVNLGSPSGTDTASVRRYLREFLSDRRVIEVPRPIWWLILNLFVLTTRPQKTGHAYSIVWNKETNEAPLITITRAQAEKLSAALVPATASSSTGRCATARRRSASRLAALKEQGCDRILVAPLYPQYAAATTATVNDEAFEALAAMRWQPAVRTLPPYHDDPGLYRRRSPNRCEASLAGLPFEPEVVLASFHGLPRAYLDKGDPYHCQCQKTARLLREKLGWPRERLQNRLPVALRRAPSGCSPIPTRPSPIWPDRARSGSRSSCRASPPTAWRRWRRSPSAARETFRENGGERLRRAPLPQRQRPRHAACSKPLVRRELAGWL